MDIFKSGVCMDVLWGFLVKRAFRYVQRREDAEDLAQETLLKMWLLTPEEGLTRDEVYARAVVTLRHRAVDAHRRAQKASVEELLASAENSRIDYETPESRALAQELLSEVLQVEDIATIQDTLLVPKPNLSKHKQRRFRLRNKILTGLERRGYDMEGIP